MTAIDLDEVDANAPDATAHEMQRARSIWRNVIIGVLAFGALFALAQRIRRRW